MASILGFDGFDGLFDADAWIEGAKQAAGGAAGILATSIAVDKLPWVKDQGAMVKGGITAALGIALGKLSEKYVGREVAGGIIGGAGGFAIARMVAAHLPESIKPALGDAFDRPLADEASDFLSEVSVESHTPGLAPGLGEVSVESHVPGLAPGLGDDEFGDLSAASISSFG